MNDRTDDLAPSAQMMLFPRLTFRKLRFQMIDDILGDRGEHCRVSALCQFGVPADIVLRLSEPIRLRAQPTRKVARATMPTATSRGRQANPGGLFSESPTPGGCNCNVEFWR